MRGNAQQTKVHYRGKNDDFVVMAESAEDVKNWKGDRSIPLAQVVNGFKVFVTHKHGAQGVLDTASKNSLHSEFGTDNEDEVITIILEKGEIQEVENSQRNGDRNSSKGVNASSGNSSAHG